MVTRPKETLSQQRFALDLRYRIDTAIMYPSLRNRTEAVGLARSQPIALASTHVQHNLGEKRLSWLKTHGVTPETGVRADIVVPDITT
jgi:transcriptional regulator with PAS, ATPase and Fis domain